MTSKLTIKQEKFCNKYLECGNASEAYRYAYSCEKMKDATVNTRAKELLKNGPITVRLEILQKELKGKSDITKEEVLERLSCILAADIRDYVFFDGSNVRFKAFDKLTDMQARAIESIKQTKYGIELKLHGVSWTVERICKMLGFDAPTKQELTGKNGKDLIPTDYSKLSDDELKQLYALTKKANG